MKNKTLTITVQVTPEQICSEIWSVVDGPVAEYMEHVFHVLAKYNLGNGEAFDAVYAAFMKKEDNGQD